MKELKKYFDLQAKIYEYFGYIEDWTVIPLEDSTDMYWILDKDTVLFAKTKEKLLDEGSELYYSNTLYNQNYLLKNVYYGKEYTMICIDTQTDGNKFLQIFDNNKQI